jgi:hypothetical protein
MQPQAPIDQQQLHETAQELSIEMQQLRDEVRVNRVPRWWHRFSDPFAEWRARRHVGKPRSTRLLAQPWVPYVIIPTIALIWVPDNYKVECLYWLDGVHERTRTRVHLWYWRQTMPAAQYAQLMEQMEKNVPRSQRVQSPNCPL